MPAVEQKHRTWTPPDVRTETIWFWHAGPLVLCLGPSYAMAPNIEPTESHSINASLGAVLKVQGQSPRTGTHCTSRAPNRAKTES
jgi:hypothetical protein